MATVQIVLFKSGNQKLVLAGEHDGTQFTVTQLQIPDSLGGAPILFDLVESVSGLMQWLDPVAGDEFSFKPTLPQAVLLQAEWEYTASKKIFGKTFDPNAALDTRLEVYIPENASGAVGQITLKVCGKINLDAGGTVFASEPLYFTIEMPASSAPRLSVALPDIGLNLPAFQFPWQFPAELPLSLPLTIPAQSFDFPPLGGRVSSRAISISVSGSELTLDIRGFVIAALQQSFEADIVLVVKDEQVDIAKSSIRVIRPEPMDFGDFPKWFFDDDCLILAGEKTQLNQLLGWLVPECDELQLEKEILWTIRLLRDGDSFEELRIDLQPKNEETVGLPGFSLMLPKDSVFHLVFRQPTNAPREFWVGLSLKKDETVTLSLPFTWERPEGREGLKSEDKTQQLQLLGDIAQDVTLMIACFAGPSRSFFKRTDGPLAPLDIRNPSQSCRPTTPTIASLANSDIRNLRFNRDPLKAFKFPFLRDETSDTKQIIRVTSYDFVPPDFAIQTIGLTIQIEINIGINVEHPALRMSGGLTVNFNWESMSLKVNHEDGINLKLPEEPPQQELFGLKWDFDRAPGDAPDFKLTTKNSHYQILQAPGTRLVLTFDKATRPDQPIQFLVTNFCLGGGGISLDAAVMNSPAKLNALDTEFHFNEGTMVIRDNRIAGFTIGGWGPLPPALVGPAMASIRLQFAQNESDHSVHLVCAEAGIQGNSLLKCDSTRFQFALTALGLKFVEEDDRYHLYFTISGMARFVLASGDDNQGPLGWLPAVEMQMVECPLTTDISVLARHINFLIPLPKQQTFKFLGCFDFELRAIGYAPMDPVFRDPTPAMIISGQVKFSNGSDAVDARVDFHNLHIGLPKPGKFFPQLYLKGLGLKLSVGSAFEVCGSVEFLDEGTDLQGGVTGEGFFGRGDVQIQGLPRITAGFAFLRVRRNPQDSPVRAWFLYLEANRFSLQFPVIRMFLREVGIGFGYRFTLAMIKSVDEVNDPKELVKVLKEQAKRQGELSQFSAWRVDLEEPGEDPRWTIALRAMIAQNSASTSPTSWNPKAEEALPNLFLIEAVMALRSDLTFLMVARAWFLTNYFDFTMEQPAAVRQQPLLTGFILLSPRKPRLLANLSSNPNAEFGKHSPVGDLVKLALKGTKFSATLLVEPGLMHYELGWPNQLRWEQNFGDVLKLLFCGGMIYRLSKTEFVIGQSYMARGELKFQAGVDFGFVGARISATAKVAYGARYIGVLAFPPRLKEDSAFYGGAGIEIHVAVSVEFWIEIDLLFGSITLDFSFSFAVNFTASVEIGLLLDGAPGVRGTATLALSIMGHDFQFGVRVALNEDGVQKAFQRTEKFLHVGLEAGEVESIPGTARTVSHAGVLAMADDSADHASTVTENAFALTDAESALAGTPPAMQADEGDPFETPSYRVLMSTVGSFTYFALIPAAELLDEKRVKSRPTHRERGFLAVPPDKNTTVTNDYELIWTAPANVSVLQADAEGQFNQKVGVSSHDKWKISWDHEIDFNKMIPKAKGGGATQTGKTENVQLRHWLGLAFQFKHLDFDLNSGSEPPPIGDWKDIDPIGDPLLIFNEEDDVVDPRVHDPSDNAFEAAVRGAVEQFKAAPYLRSSNGEYDETLRQAFDNKTTIYSNDGKPADPPGPELSPEHLKNQQIFQTRSVVLRKVITDFQQHVQSATPLSLSCKLGLVFRANLNTTDPIARRNRLGRLVESLNGAKIRQRTEKNKAEPTASEQPVRVFNEPKHSFAETTPNLDRLVHLAHEGSVGLDWGLKWAQSRPRVVAAAKAEVGGGRISQIVVQPGSAGYSPSKPPQVDISPPEAGGVRAEAIVDANLIDPNTGELQPGAITITKPGSNYSNDPNEAPTVSIAAPPRGRAESNPEQHLDHYLIRRKWLDGSDGDREFRVKPCDVLHLDVTNKKEPRLKRLRPRFQFIDHFEDEPPEFLASLPPEGRRYAYTIVPVDVSGVPSSRSRTVIVRRFPASPPPVVTQSEFIVDYVWPEKLEAGNVPRLWPVEQVNFLWSPPMDPDLGPRVAVAKLRLVFRRDEVLALGQYAQDSDVGGPRSNGLPSSNARPLRSDETMEILLSDNDIEEMADKESHERRYSIKLSRPKQLDELEHKLGVKIGAPTQAGPDWQPRSWRVYVQTCSDAGVYSALAPVNLRLRFKRSGDSVPLLKSAREERRPSTLEWVPFPVKSAMLPPRDQTGVGGFAMVPMPPPTSLDLSNPKLGTFCLHPARRRCLQMTWNQVGALDAPVEPKPADYPREFHAGFELYEFDADADASQEINTLSPAEQQLPTWVAHAQLERRQQFELLPDDLLLVTPANTSDTQKWEAWYPSTVQRRKLALERSAKAGLPASKATFSPWFSWRESVLIWPNVSTNIIEEIAGKEPRTWKSLVEFDKDVRKRWVRTNRIHPLLEIIISKTLTLLDSHAEPPLATGRSHSVEYGPAPVSPDQWAPFHAATNAAVDPYGWSVLARLGLATSFVIRNPEGTPLSAEQLHASLFVEIKEALALALADPNHLDFKSHLHVELTYQPAKATRRAETEQIHELGEVKANELLAVVQLSLRPSQETYAKYYRYLVPLLQGPDDKLKIDATGLSNTYYVAVPEDSRFDQLKIEPNTKTELVPPSSASGRGAALLIRAVSRDLNPVRPKVSFNNSPVPDAGLVEFDPTDAASRNFDADDGELADVIQHQHEDKYWVHLQHLIEALNLDELPPGQLKLQLPSLADTSLRSELFAWLSRFFDHGGNRLDKNPTGPWLATAYMRSAPVMAIAPNAETSVLEYFHPVEDWYAHAWRYYLRPVGRYERLLLSLGQSHTLFRTASGTSDSEAIADNLSVLNAFKPPAPGGLDLVLPRIRPVSAPTILFSGRLDGPLPQKADALKPKPPGKSWQVVIAKHSEQMLVERNRTLARRLAFRQISVALMRRFQFDEKANCFYDAWLTDEFSATAKVLNDPAQEKLILKVDNGAEEELPLPGEENTINGLFKALTSALLAKLPNTGLVKQFVLDRCDRNAMQTRFSTLLLRSKKTVTLTLRSGQGPDVNMFTLRGPKQGRPTPSSTTQTTEPQLPGELTPLPRHDPLKPFTVESIHELRDYDLPSRLGRFGQGALVYQWQTLPYYYEHLVMAVAQSTDVVSDVTTTLQRDFEYASPMPRAIMDAQLINNQRFRRVQIRLENFWNCLPQQPSAQTRWPMENPRTESPHDPRPHAAVADPAVVYQLVVLRPGAVVQALSQIYFEAGQPHQYNVRNFPTKVGSQQYETQICSRRPWGVDPRRPFEEYLETVLIANATDVRLNRPISSRHRFDRLTPESGTAKLRTPDEPLGFVQTATLALMQRLTRAEFAALETLLTATRPGDDAYRTQARRFLDRIPGIHAVVEMSFEDQATLPALYVPQAPRQADVALRRIDPSLAVLSWTGWRPEQPEMDFLRALVTTANSAVSAVVRATIEKLLDRLGQDVTELHEELSIGLDQLTELAENSAFAVIDDRLKQVTWSFTDWNASLTDGQKKVLKGFSDAKGTILGWINIAPCAGTLRALLAALETLTESFTATEAFPPTPTSGDLVGRATTEAGRLIWKQGATTDAQFTALGDWANDQGFGATFRAAVQRLIGRLTTIRLGFDKTETTPTMGGNQTLKDRLEIDKSGAVGQVIWKLRPLRPEERLELETMSAEASGFGPTFRTAIGRLLDIGDKAAVQVDIVETDFAPRPDPQEFVAASASLAEKAGLCRGEIEFTGLMLKSEEESLERVCRLAVDRASIRQLYNEAIRSGFEGGELQIQAFRGSAENHVTPIQPFLQ